MSAFKVGQRVRINCPDSRNHGCQGTIWKIEPNYRWPHLDVEDGITQGTVAHYVDVDGRGRITAFGSGEIAYPAHELQPLTDTSADEWATNAVRKVTKVEPINVAPKVTV